MASGELEAVIDEAFHNYAPRALEMGMRFLGIGPRARPQLAGEQIDQRRNPVTPEKRAEEARIRLRRPPRFARHDPVEIVENVRQRSHQRRLCIRTSGTAIPPDVACSKRSPSW